MALTQRPLWQPLLTGYCNIHTWFLAPFVLQSFPLQNMEWSSKHLPRLLYSEDSHMAQVCSKRCSSNLLKEGSPREGFWFPDKRGKHSCPCLIPPSFQSFCFEGECYTWFWSGQLVPKGSKYTAKLALTLSSCWANSSSCLPPWPFVIWATKNRVFSHMQAKAFLLDIAGPPNVFPELPLEVSLSLSHFEK